MVLDTLPATELGGIDEMRRAEFVRPCLLVVVDVDYDNLSCFVLHCSLHNGQTNTACTEDGDVGSFFDLGCYCRCAVAGRDAAAQQTRSISRTGLGDCHHGDIRDNGVLRKGRATHEVK